MEPAIIQPVMRIPWGNIPVRDWARSHLAETLALIREMVEIESPSDDPAALRRFADWFSSRVREQFGAGIERHPDGHLQCRWGARGRGATSAQVMALGHYDTVWPMGTLGTMPFREADGRAWGPGVLDMKSGIAVFLMALRGLGELGVDVPARLLLQLNADEETGSHTSRTLTEDNASASQAVLVLEPGTGLAGRLKTSRKGVGDYRICVTGRASHAGVDFEAGSSAILELSRQLLQIAAWTDTDRGITVNPGVVRGGTRANVIAAEAVAVVDVRVPRVQDAVALAQAFGELRAVDARCTIAVEGGLNRPPMERSEGIAKLFGLAQELGRHIGLEIEESATGGGSDGNFTAALGVPTLDGIGAIGEGAHASNESVLVGRLADRTALVAMLIAEISRGETL